MDDVIGRFWIIIVGCVLCFIIPVAILAAKHDDLAEEYIEKYVHDFVDNTAATARITDFSYSQLVNHVSKADANVDIAIWHSARYQTPYQKPDGTIGVYTAEEDYGIDHILACMYPDDYSTYDYELKEGDYIQVVITQREPTLSQRITGVFLRGSQPLTVYETYGRYVGNEVQ